LRTLSGQRARTVAGTPLGHREARPRHGNLLRRIDPATTPVQPEIEMI
jgi:hypothetical protein